MSAAEKERQQEAVVFGVSNVRCFAAALHCIRAGNKQICIVSISSGGLSLVWEDESKALQGSVFLKPEVFSRFDCGNDVRHDFGLQLQLLLDTLAVFASTSAPMTAYYPGAQGELVCEMNDAGPAPGQRRGGSGGRDAGPLGPGSVCTWARVVGLEAEAVVDLGQYWTEPASSFLCSGLALKEAVDDLEWPGGPVEVAMRQDPQALTMTASGHGSLEVRFSANQLTSFNCQQPEVRHSYKYRHLKAAFCNLPHPKDCSVVSTKASIDLHGLLKVTHMVSMEPAAGGRSGGADFPSAMLESQRAHDSGKIAVVQFLVQPTDEEGAA